MGATATTIKLENNTVELTFHRSTGRLERICNKLAGDNYLKYPLAWHGHTLAVICLDPQNRKVPLFPGEVEDMRLATGSLTITYSRLFYVQDATRLQDAKQPGTDPDTVPMSARVTIHMAPDNPETLWTLQLTNQTSDLHVVEVLFPYFRGLQLGNTHTDDVIVYPHHAGEKTINPVETYASPRYLNYNRANTVKEADGAYSREINYCGLASMMWMDYYDPLGGFYLASYDPEFLLTGLRVETGGPEAPWMGFSIRKYTPCEPGATWVSHPYGVGIHAGDWHWGADRYRAWFRRVVPATESSRKLKEEFAVSPRYDFRNGGRIIHRFEEIPEMFEADRAEGVNHFFIAGWNRRGFDNNYPEYHPDLELGTPVELANGCRYVHTHGGMVTFYINARIFDTASDYFPTSGRAWALKDEQGQLSHEIYEPQIFAVMCPNAPGWQKHLVDTATWMAKAYGAWGIYLDQLGSATPFPCYDPAHGHTHHGMFNHGYLKILAGVNAGLQKLDPRAFIMIENCGDIYGQYVSGNLTWNGELYDEFFNLYKYTFPEYIQVNMVHPRHIDDRSTREKYFYNDVERAMLLGSIFWVAFNRRFPPEDDDLKEYMRKALLMRRALAPYFAAGRFVDEIGIRTEGPVRATHWVLERDLEGPEESREKIGRPGKMGHLIVVGNPDLRSEAVIQLPEETLPFQAVRGILCLTLETGFAPAKSRVEGRNLILPVPASRLSAFLVRS